MSEYQLKGVKTKTDIPHAYRGTPIGLLLEYHNLTRTFAPYAQAQLLIGMCMDNRKYLRIPDNFAYIIRSGGANLRYSEFKVSYAIGVGNVRHIALIGHNNCGMVNIVARKGLFVNGLVRNAGWDRQAAQEHFMNLAPLYEIDNAEEFTVCETARLRKRYPKITVAPLFYRIEDNLLYCIRE